MTTESRGNLLPENVPRLQIWKNFFGSNIAAEVEQLRNEVALSSDDMFTSLNDIPTQTRSISSGASVNEIVYPAQMYDKGSIATSSCFDSDAEDTDYPSEFSTTHASEQVHESAPSANGDQIGNILNGLLGSARQVNKKQDLGDIPVTRLDFNSFSIPNDVMDDFTLLHASTTPKAKKRAISSKDDSDLMIARLANQLRGLVTTIDVGIDLQREKYSHLEQVRKAALMEKEKEIQKLAKLAEERRHKENMLETKLRVEALLEKEKSKLLADCEETKKKEAEKYNEQARVRMALVVELRKLKKDQENMAKELERVNRENKERAERENVIFKRELKQRIARQQRLNAEQKLQEEIQKEHQLQSQKQRRQINRTPLRVSLPPPARQHAPSLPISLAVVPATTSNAVCPLPQHQGRRPSLPSTSTPISPSSSNDDDANSLLSVIPDDFTFTQTSQTPSHVIRHYQRNNNHIKWSKNNHCGCETLQYDEHDFYFKSNYGVDAVVRHFSENNRITVTFADIEVISYPNKQLEIRRQNGELTVFAENGKRFERIKCGEEIVTEVYDGDSRLRAITGGVQAMSFSKERQSEREDGSYLATENGADIIYHPDFRLGRSLMDSYDRVFQVYVYHLGSNQREYLRINVCPTCSVFTIKHCHSVNATTVNKHYCSAFKSCEHLSA